MPCRAIWEAPGFGQEAEAGVREKSRSEPLLGFPGERRGKAGETIQGWLV